MKITDVARPAGTALLLALGFASTAAAGGRNPGALLLYPEFDNTAGVVTVLTVTNVDDADVTVEFKYIGIVDAQGQPVNCEEFNRLVPLTGNDTLTLLTNFHNPELEQGFVYVYAREGGLPADRNVLIGSQLVVNGIDNFDYSLNPVAYFSNPGNATTWISANGLLDLDGVEYEGTPDEIYVPRFFGQGAFFQSELILIGLTGGAQFDTWVDFLIYNDNETVFSSEHQFHCWEKLPLMAISGVFSQNFLANATNDDPAEVLGAPGIESGWFQFKGALAQSPTDTFNDPSVYGVLIERSAGNEVGVADLPWESPILRTNGALLPRSNDGQR